MKSLLNVFGRSKNRNSANTAKERLQIIISNERAKQKGPEYLPLLQKDLIEVIAKYVSIEPEHVRVEMDDTGELLELNIMLPDIDDDGAAAASATS